MSDNTVSVKSINVDDIMAFTFYAKVNRVMDLNESTTIRCTNLDNGNQFDINGEALIETGKSADQYYANETVSKMKAAEILLSAKDDPFTVKFVKADGKVRTLRGRLASAEPLLGRSMVIDLDIDSDNQLRQVDHRTIKSLILRGVQYTVR